MLSPMPIQYVPALCPKLWSPGASMPGVQCAGLSKGVQCTWSCEEGGLSLQTNRDTQSRRVGIMLGHVWWAKRRLSKGVRCTWSCEEGGLSLQTNRDTQSRHVGIMLGHVW
eukprot:1158716-Pelagomonas_calceolata.AAC.1